MSLRSSLAIGPKLVLVSILSLAILCSLASCIWLNRDPVAVLSASSTAGEVPLEVAFDAYQSHDPDGDRVSCEWDFGDGQIAQGMAVQHGFGSPGQYTVRLLVTDSHGNSDSATITISVTQASSVISGRQQFDADDGIQYSSSTGLSIVIQPQGFDETLMLVVAEDPTPQQPAGYGIEINCVYSITVESSHYASTSWATRSEGCRALSGIRLTLSIPPGTDPAKAVILEWTSGGWVLAGSGDCLGGALSPDGEHIYVDLPHLSDYASGTYEWVDYDIDNWSAAESNGWDNPLGNTTQLETNTGYDYDSGAYLSYHKARHTSIDIHANAGSPVYAIADGIIVYANAGDDARQNVIIVAHRDASNKAFFAVYGHVMPGLAEPRWPGTPKAADPSSQGFEQIEDLTPTFEWEPGAVGAVAQGQLIGTVVKSGSPSHLHFGINTSSEMSDFRFKKMIAVDGKQEEREWGWGTVPKETVGTALSEWGWTDPVDYLGNHRPSLASPTSEADPDAGSYGLYIRDLQSGRLVFPTSESAIRIAGSSYPLPSGVLEWGREYRWNMSTDDSSNRRRYSSESLHFTTANESPIVIPTSLTISGQSQVGEGDTEPYTCTATFSDGSSRVVTSESTWSLSVSSSYATISNGQLTAKTLSSDKSCTITARFEDNGVAKSATKTITLKDDPPIVVPTSLTISGQSQVGESDTEPYTCTATFSDGSSRVVTSESTWSLSVSSSYATISNGQLTAKTLSSDKSCTITARFEDNGVAKSATKTITLKDDPPIVVPTSLTISGQSQVGEGDTEPYTCTATFSDGSSRVVTSESTWSLSVSSSYATISNGQLTAKTLSSDKSCTITARFEDNGVAKSATKTITLKDDPPIVVPTSLTISGQSQVGEGDTEPYTCTATFSDGSSRVVTSESTWSLSVSSSYATISNGQLTAKTLSSDKSCTITARFEDNGVAKSATKTITLKDDPPTPSLNFSGLSPSTISTSQSTYQATLQATGSNFLNVNRVSYSWSGPDSGSMTWYKGDSNWNSAVVDVTDTSMTLKPMVLSNATGTQSQTWNWTVTLRDSTGATDSQWFTVTYDPPPPTPTLDFASLSPSTISTSQSTYQATLQATGSNFLNVNRVSYSWSGPDSGSMTWYKGDSNWNSAVVDVTDTSMTLKPMVLSNATGTQSQTWNWTVTLRDSTGATDSQWFTVTYDPPPPTPTLDFASLSPSTISTSQSTYQATLQATGSNFLNVNRVSYSWSGPDSGSMTWYKGDSNWNSAVVDVTDTSMTLKPMVLSNATGTQSQTWNWTVTLRDSTGATDSQWFTVTYDPPPPTPTLDFASLSPSTISTSQSTYQATLQATGSNFLNVNRVSYSWSGPDSGSMTWYKGDSNWNSAVVDVTDTSMTLKPMVLSNATGTQSQTWNWTVTLRDSTGATDSQWFTVTYNPPTPGIHVGDRVEANQNLNVRQCARAYDSICPEITDPDYIGYAPDGTDGTVVDGPESADGYVWWEVQFDAGYTGWSVENGLDEI